MFAWFGGEEQGLFGSNHLVNNYLYKEVIEKYGSSFAGAYITDMIMVNDSATGSQYLPSYMESVSRVELDQHSIERERERAQC